MKLSMTPYPNNWYAFSTISKFVMTRGIMGFAEDGEPKFIVVVGLIRVIFVSLFSFSPYKEPRRISRIVKSLLHD